MPIQASVNDKKAAALGRKIDKLIKLVRTLPPKATYTPEIKALSEAIEKEHPWSLLDPQTPYTDFLYQQLLRANDYRFLFNPQNPRRGSDSPTFNISSDQAKGPQFRDVVKQAVDGKEHFLYSTDQHAFGEGFTHYCSCHPTEDQPLVTKFAKFYHDANMQIGGATQKSNVRGRFAQAGLFFAETATSKTQGQRQDDYHKFSDLEHEYWQAQYLLARRSIENGNDLSDEQCSALGLGEGPINPYYVMPRFRQAEAHPNLVHIGHASTLLNAGPFRFVADPLHYQSGTEGTVIRLAASLLYPRETSPAFPTTRYPGGQIVWISHNHHDHLCLNL